MQVLVNKHRNYNVYLATLLWCARKVFLTLCNKLNPTFENLNKYSILIIPKGCMQFKIIINFDQESSAAI